MGPNSLEIQEGSGPLTLLLRQVHNPLIYLMAGAAALSLFVGHAVDAGVIAGVLVLTTLLSFEQEWRAEGALAALSRMAFPHAKVLRDGSPTEINAAEVVPVDILILETCDRVAADARLVAAEELQVDESAFTGESIPLGKSLEVADQKYSIGGPEKPGSHDHHPHRRRGSGSGSGKRYAHRNGQDRC